MKITKKIINELIKKYPEEKQRIKTGVKQVEKLWRKEDGDEKAFYDFCINNFKTGEELEIIFNRFNENIEYIRGHLTALYLKLRMYLDEDRGKLSEVDRYFANLNLAIHLEEDMYKTKLAFVILLNYPVKLLDEVLKEMNGYSRKDWAKTRLGQMFKSRVPSEIGQILTESYSKASEYIYSYNIQMEKVTDKNGRRIFEPQKLISHWGLRDQIKLYYSSQSEKNLNKQETIYKLMENVVYGYIPDEFIFGDSKDKTYSPFNAEYNGKKIKHPSLTRYQHLINIFNAHRKEDKFYIVYPNYIDRIFNITREIPFEKMERILKDVLESKVSFKVAEIIKNKLKRELKPFDIWYNGFRDNSVKIDLDKEVKKIYKTGEDFQKNIINILKKLDFDSKTAKYLSEKIEVDPARGAGHAWGPEMRGEKAHLRTRLVNGKYMDWQGFNTAMHELGHCVEQIFTLYDIDYNLLSGVPNTAFTEAFAFVFQNKSLEILGVKPTHETIKQNTLQTFWDTREIAGVALVDMYVWKWMYRKQRFTAAQLRDAVIKIAKDLWNKYYYPVFKIKDSPILAVYSHMIYSGLYLPDYPLGHIIAYNIEKYFEKRSIGCEMKRMCQLGSITPVKWMKEATGDEISAEKLIKDTEKVVLEEVE